MWYEIKKKEMNETKIMQVLFYKMNTKPRQLTLCWLKVEYMIDMEKHSFNSAIHRYKKLLM